jgi:hypothetical protein
MVDNHRQLKILMALLNYKHLTVKPTFYCKKITEDKPAKEGWLTANMINSVFKTRILGSDQSQYMNTRLKKLVESDKLHYIKKNGEEVGLRVYRLKKDAFVKLFLEFYKASFEWEFMLSDYYEDFCLDIPLVKEMIYASYLRNRLYPKTQQSKKKDKNGNYEFIVDFSLKYKIIPPTMLYYYITYNYKNVDNLVRDMAKTLLFDSKEDKSILLQQIEYSFWVQDYLKSPKTTIKTYVGGKQTKIKLNSVIRGILEHINQSLVLHLSNLDRKKLIKKYEKDSPSISRKRWLEKTKTEVKSCKKQTGV